MFIELDVHNSDSEKQTQAFNTNFISMVLPNPLGSELFINGRSIIVSNKYETIIDIIGWEE